MKSFPAELGLMALGHLRDDSESLSACTLVCHEWVPLARHYLFAALDAELPPPPSQDLIRLPQSIAELASGISARGPYLNELRIHTPLRKKSEPGVLQHSIIFHLVKNLPKLQALRLQDISIVHNEFNEVPSGLSIDTLELSFGERLVERPVASTITVLKLFSNIKNLSVVIQHKGRDKKEQQTQILPVQQIEHFELDATVTQLCLLQGTIHSQSVIGTVALQPHMETWNEVVELGPIIQSMSSRLVSLKLAPGLPSSRRRPCTLFFHYVRHGC